MTTGSLVVLVGMMLVSNRSNRRERLLLIIFIVSVVSPVISPPPIPEQLRTRMQGIDGVLHVDGCAREQGAATSPKER